jgi:phosphatidate cytidylyltransferase
MKAATNKDKETQTRVITGVVGGVALLILLLAGGRLGVSFAAAILGGVMCWELSNVFYSLSDRKEKTTAVVGTSWLVIFVNMLFPRSMLECAILSFMAFFMYYLATAERHPQNLRKHFDEFVFTVFAIMYVMVFITFLPMVRDGPNGIRWLILFLLCVWSGDTGAYFVGRRYGKTKLYPLISPGKSVEGSCGGLLSTMAIALIFKFTIFTGLTVFGALSTEIVVGISSQIGDLCESFFKRSYGIKDSSQILPGHGGFLDRFDGVLFSLPVMYFCVKVFS